MLRKKSEAEIAADRAQLKRLVRCYAFPIIAAAIAAVLFLFWALGYAAGYLDGFNGRQQVMESSND